MKATQEIKERSEEIKKEVSKINEYVQAYRDDPELGNFSSKDGECTIFVDLSTDPIYKEYSGKSLLSNEIYDFIEDTFDFTKSSDYLTIEIKYPESMTEAEKNKIQKLYRAHYALKYNKTRRDIRRDRLTALAFVVIGVIILGIDIAFRISNPDSLWGEVIDIFAWIFIWEAGDLFTFTTLQNQQKAAEYLKLLSVRLK